MYKESVVLYSKKSWSAFILLFTAIISIFLISCDNPKKDSVQIKKYFDLKGFMERQIAELDQKKPVVDKTMKMGEEQNSRSSNEINWKKELELFLQADINKPAYIQSYIVSRPDSSTYEYGLKQGQDLPVRYLKIKLDKANGMPVRIEAQLKSQNKLYESEKNINLSCQIKGESCKILTYHISGFQKLATMEKKPFVIEAVIKQ